MSFFFQSTVGAVDTNMSSPPDRLLEDLVEQKTKYWGVFDSLIRPYIPNLPACHVVVVPSKFKYERIGAGSQSVRTETKPERLVVDRVIPSIHRTYFMGRAVSEIKDYKMPDLVTVTREKVPINLPLYGEQRESGHVAWNETMLEETGHTTEEIATWIKNGERPTILLTPKGAMVYPHPKIFVKESPKNTYEQSIFEIKVTRSEPAAVTDQYQVFDLDVYFRRVTISSNPVENVNDVRVTVAKRGDFIHVARYPDLDVDAMHPNERLHLTLLTDSGELPPKEESPRLGFAHAVIPTSGSGEKPLTL